jgi:hypothetical protein
MFIALTSNTADSWLAMMTSPKKKQLVLCIDPKFEPWLSNNSTVLYASFSTSNVNCNQAN